MQKPAQLSPEREMESVTTEAAVSSSISTGSKYNAACYHHLVKPLLHGCLAGELTALVRYGIRLTHSHDPVVKKTLPDYKIKTMPCFKQLLRKELLYGVTHSTASLGMFEILTKKLRKANDGMPLTLYQEAWCGLASGATAGFIWKPFELGCSRAVGSQNLTYGHLCSTLSHIVRNEGVLSLWRGSGGGIGASAMATMGMLASYNRSLKYLRESKGLPKNTAEISASMISVFFAAACGYPCWYLLAITENVKDYRKIPHLNSRILNPYNGFGFYTGFVTLFRRYAWFYAVQWMMFEKLRTYLGSADP